MKIYTKTGDKGETGLFGGKRISKDSLRIAAYGEIDELNSVLGICRVINKIVEIDKVLHQLQREICDLAADLATPLDEKLSVPRMKKSQVQQIEDWIDEISNKVEPLKNFILPGGSILASYLHFARAVCRRAERTIVALQKKEEISKNIAEYVNRLSDLMFVMARYMNRLDGVKDEKWTPKKWPLKK